MHAANGHKFIYAMKSICKFNPKTDYTKSVPNLSINLSSAMENGVVPSSGNVPEHNGLEHSSDIGPRAQDAFEAIDMQRSAMALGKAQSSADAEAAAASAAVSQVQTNND